MVRSAPSPAQVHRAIEQISPTDVGRAALHLSLPADQPLDHAVLVIGDTWTWRGISVDAGEDPIAAASLLAHLGGQDGDEYLDLEAEPEAWLKVQQSGSRLMAFGTEALFDAPTFTAELEVAPDLLRRAVQEWRAHRHVPLSLTDAAGVVLVDEAEELYTLRTLRTAGSQAAREAADPRDLEAWLAHALGAEPVEHRVVGTREHGVEIEYHLRLPNAELVVPVLTTDTSEVVGAPTHDLLPLPGHQAAPEGWVWRGWDRWSGAPVAEHTASGVLARVTAL